MSKDILLILTLINNILEHLNNNKNDDNLKKASQKVSEAIEHFKNSK